MDPPQLGESSRSPTHRLSGGISNGANGIVSNGHQESHLERRMSRLILPDWDVPEPKHVHASHDLISLLHLDPLYNTYVRPYADAIGPEDDHFKTEGNGDDHEGEGKKKKGRGAKKPKLEKGYQHLIDDCIDPTPTGEKKDNLSILPLIPDLMDFSGAMVPMIEEAPQLIPRDLFQAAKLEAGLKQDGYANGNKLGVSEAEERRRRKKARQVQSSAPDLPSPAIPSPHDQGADALSTPLAPIAPPAHLVRPPFPVNNTRRPSIPQRGGPPPSIRGGPLRPGQGLPSRPPSAYPLSSSGLGTKRSGEALGALNPKRTKPGGGSRSASPLPQGQGQGLNAERAIQGRPGVGKTPRSRTDDV